MDDGKALFRRHKEGMATYPLTTMIKGEGRLAFYRRGVFSESLKTHNPSKGVIP